MVAGSTVLVTDRCAGRGHEIGTDRRGPGLHEQEPGKKVYRKYYRSLNFSTTRTLSPRTVIGIGTTLS